MPVTPTGPLSLPFAEMRTILAASSTWQTLCDADDAAEAAEHIYLFDLPPTTDAVRLPAIVIGDEDMLLQVLSWDGDQSGQVLVEFLLPLTVEDATGADLQLQFRNSIGQVLVESLALRGTTIPVTGESYMNLLRWRKLVAPQELTDGEPRFGVADALWCAFIAEWV